MIRACADYETFGARGGLDAAERARVAVLLSRLRWLCRRYLVLAPKFVWCLVVLQALGLRGVEQTSDRDRARPPPRVSRESGADQANAEKYDWDWTSVRPPRTQGLDREPDIRPSPNFIPLPSAFPPFFSLYVPSLVESLRPQHCKRLRLENLRAKPCRVETSIRLQRQRIIDGIVWKVVR